MSESVAQGEIWLRGDNGRPVLVISNDMWHRGGQVVIVCAVFETAPDAGVHAANVRVEGTAWTVVPGMVFWLPASALTRRLGTCSPAELEQTRRILHAAIGP